MVQKSFQIILKWIELPTHNSSDLACCKAQFLPWMKIVSHGENTSLTRQASVAACVFRLWLSAVVWLLGPVLPCTVQYWYSIRWPAWHLHAGFAFWKSLQGFVSEWEVHRCYQLYMVAEVNKFVIEAVTVSMSCLITFCCHEFGILNSIRFTSLLLYMHITAASPTTAGGKCERWPLSWLNLAANCVATLRMKQRI